MNDWVDENCFFTVGRAMLDGKVPYRDLCEQKGMIVYAVFAVASLISATSFFGVFIIEWLCFAAFLYFGCECVIMYRGAVSTRSAAAVITVLAFSSSVCVSFSHGGSVEEFSLFMITLSMLWVLRAVRKSADIKNLHAVMIGVFAGVALWSKFTFLGFYFGLCIGIAIYYIKRKSFARLASNAACFIAGAALVTAPVTAYFAYNGALDAMFETYFYDNIFLYPGESGGGTVMKALSLLINIPAGTVLSVPLNGLAGVLNVVWWYFLVKNRKTNSGETLIAFPALLFLSVATFFGGKYFATYYSLIHASFAPLGVAAAYDIFTKIRAKKSFAYVKQLSAVCAVLLVLSPLAAFLLSPNTYLIKYKKSDMPQYKFAETVRKRENATLLNYGFLDGGFYTAADVIPECKYFCRLNIELPEMDKEQRRVVEERLTDFVVTRDMRLEDAGLDCSGYRIADTAEMVFEGQIRTYYLYELSENATDG